MNLLLSPRYVLRSALFTPPLLTLQPPSRYLIASAPSAVGDELLSMARVIFSLCHEMAGWVGIEETYLTQLGLEIVRQGYDPALQKRWAVGEGIYELHRHGYVRVEEQGGVSFTFVRDSFAALLQPAP